MSRRIDIELTSQRDADTWTWRAAGAKEPKGVLDAALLSKLMGEPKPGDRLRAEADFEIDGIFISEVLPLKARSGRPESERLEIVGKSFKDGVTTQLSKKGKGRGKDRKGPRKRRSDTGKDGAERRGATDSNDGEHAKRGRGRSKSPRSGRGSDRTRNTGKNGTSTRRSSSRRDNRANRDSKADDLPRTPKAPRLRPGQVHRKAYIESLPTEQQILAEQLLKGGIAAVRAEIDSQNEQAKESGGDKIKADGLIRLSETLLPKLRAAEWRDRAEAALKNIDKVDLRDLRAALVAAEDFSRDSEARELTEKIRVGLSIRLDRSQTEWHEELRRTIGAGRVVRALHLSSRPPKPGVPLPPDLAKDLTEQANAALGSGNTQQRLAIVLEAVAYSPVRPYVVLSSAPSEPEAELLEVVTKLAARIPEIAKQLGIAPKVRRIKKAPKKAPKPAGESAPKPAGKSETSKPVEPEIAEAAPTETAPIAAGPTEAEPVSN